MQTAKRYGLAAGLATGVTVTLLLIMTGMIKPTGDVVETRKPAPPINYVRLEDEPELIVKDERKPPPKPEPEPETNIEVPIDPHGGGVMDVSYAPPGAGDPPKPGVGFSNNDMIPILRGAPTYPQSAARRGLEGYVIVEFTVDEAGRTRDAHVLYGQPQQIFDRAALKAVERYKYKPRVVEGRPVRVHGVRQRIIFELADA